MPWYPRVQMLGKHGGSCLVRAGTAEDTSQVAELPRLVGGAKEKGEKYLPILPFPPMFLIGQTFRKPEGKGAWEM